MEEGRARRAVAAATAIATGFGLAVDRPVVLQASNKLTLRLLPADLVARIAHGGADQARFEVALARGLAAAGSPVAALDPRVPPGPHEADGFVVTLWTHHEPRGPADPAAVADALVRLHAGLRTLEIAAPHFTDRVAEARALVEDRDLTAVLADADRDLLLDTLRDRQAAIAARGAPEQLLHGEPHPGNVLGTDDGLRFIDLETCCRGPVEFDLAHVTEPVSRCHPSADPDLLADCRVLALAMVTAWRCDPEDRLPDGDRVRVALLDALRAGPPWPTLDDVFGGLPPA